jgi:hypothetical protein
MGPQHVVPLTLKEPAQIIIERQRGGNVAVVLEQGRVGGEDPDRSMRALLQFATHCTAQQTVADASGSKRQHNVRSIPAEAEVEIACEIPRRPERAANRMVR